jgi:dihydrofolate reductase
MADHLALTEVDADFPDADRHFPVWPSHQFTTLAGDWQHSRTGQRFRFIDHYRKE